MTLPTAALHQEAGKSTGTQNNTKHKVLNCDNRYIKFLQRAVFGIIGLYL